MAASVPPMKFAYRGMNRRYSRGKSHLLYYKEKKMVEMGGVEPPSKMFNWLALQA